MRLIDADALIKEIKMDIEDVGLQEKMVFYRINEALQAEPSDGDLISRQDAIEAVKQAIYNHDSAIMRITSLPSAPVEVVVVGEWIPVSERLPSERGRYLVTYYGSLTGKGIGMMWYGKPSMPNIKVNKRKKYFYESDGEWGDIIYEEVTAWMPLPEPYEGGDDE